MECLSVDDHAAELPHLEQPAAATDTDLAEEQRPPRIQLDCEGDYEQKGDRSDQDETRNDPIDDKLRQLAPANDHSGGERRLEPQEHGLARALADLDGHGVLSGTTRASAVAILFSRPQDTKPSVGHEGGTG